MQVLISQFKSNIHRCSREYDHIINNVALYQLEYDNIINNVALYQLEYDHIINNVALYQLEYDHIINKAIRDGKYLAPPHASAGNVHPIKIENVRSSCYIIN